MRYQRDGFAVEALIERNDPRPLPEWYEEEPLLAPGEEFYMSSFRDLDTERALGMGPGRIPWSKIEDYGIRKGLDSVMIDVFHAVMREMDDGYLEWASKERARNAKK